MPDPTLQDGFSQSSESGSSLGSSRPCSNPALTRHPEFDDSTRCDGRKCPGERPVGLNTILPDRGSKTKGQTLSNPMDSLYPQAIRRLLTRTQKKGPKVVGKTYDEEPCGCRERIEEDTGCHRRTTSALQESTQADREKQIEDRAHKKFWPSASGSQEKRHAADSNCKRDCNDPPDTPPKAS
jgi:hypothetical protein